VLTRRRLRLYGEQVARQQTDRLKAMQEGLGAIRDVLLNGDQPAYSGIFRAANLKLARAQSRIVFLSQSPRFVVEGLGMIAIASVAYALSRQPGGFTAAIPLLGAFAMGAQRMLPSLQQIYSAWATMRAGNASLADVLAHVSQPLGEEYGSPAGPPLRFEKSIVFHDIHFAYGGSEGPVLENLNLTIPKGSTVGFVGATGSGKSTVVDLLMGLLEPKSGQILIDDVPLDSTNRRAWRRNIAHVPQAIFLADASLAQNIAFGVPRASIDLEGVARAAEAAQISDLAGASSAGYDSGVGERGIRLSGGQRQRIGIARALYKQASVLVFDEATSALDRATEQSVMEAVQGLGPDKTIILVAHRLSTLRGCDLIFMLEAGEVSAVGTYEELIKGSQSFRLLASDGAG
jgi:ATP-binding cassette subfamily B protein